MADNYFNKYAFLDYKKLERQRKREQNKQIMSVVDKVFGGLFSIIDPYMYSTTNMFDFSGRKSSLTNRWTEKHAEYFHGKKVKHITKNKKHMWVIEMNGYIYPVLKEWIR